MLVFMAFPFFHINIGGGRPNEQRIKGSLRISLETYVSRHVVQTCGINAYLDMRLHICTNLVHKCLKVGPRTVLVGLKLYHLLDMRDLQHLIKRDVGVEPSQHPL